MREHLLFITILFLLPSAAIGQSFTELPNSLNRDYRYIEWVRAQIKTKSYSTISEQAKAYTYSGLLPFDKTTALHYDQVAYSLRKTADYQEALDLFNQKLAFVTTLKDTTYISAVQLRHALILKNLGQYDDAISILKSSGPFFVTPRDSIRLNYNLAAIEWAASNYSKYKTHSKRGLEIAQRIGHNITQLRGWTYLLALETDINRDGVKAAELLAEYESILNEQSRPADYIARDVYRALVTKLRDGNYTLAAAQLDSALARTRAQNNYFWEWSTLREVGRLHRETGDHEQAAEWFGAMLALAESREDVVTENKAHAELLETHLASGNEVGMVTSFITLRDRRQLFRHPELTQRYYWATNRGQWASLKFAAFWRLAGIPLTVCVILIGLGWLAYRHRKHPIVVAVQRRFTLPGAALALAAEEAQKDPVPDPIVQAIKLMLFNDPVIESALKGYRARVRRMEHERLGLETELEELHAEAARLREQIFNLTGKEPGEDDDQNGSQPGFGLPFDLDDD